MAIRIAINGYGRIGRQILRAIYEYKLQKQFQVVAINGSGSLEVNAHLTQFDTVHGCFAEKVSYVDNQLVINGDAIDFFSTRDVEKLPWKKLGVDLVMECTGSLVSKAKASAHLDGGAEKVLISAPGDADVDATIVYGVNHHVLRSAMRVISNASCTTNCLAPAVKIFHDQLGIEKGLMTTIHAFTNDQTLTDIRHKDLRRARSAVANMIPTKTGAAKAVGLVLPDMAGKLDGFAVRVPTINVSLVDFTFEALRATTVEEVNEIARSATEGTMKKILGYNNLPLVSSDFNHTKEAGHFDATLTKVLGGNLVKVLLWYDNEWGFCCQMLNVAQAMFAQQVSQ